jgi:hypothetical protein
MEALFSTCVSMFSALAGEILAVVQGWNMLT